MTVHANDAPGGENATKSCYPPDHIDYHLSVWMDELHDPAMAETATERRLPTGDQASSPLFIRGENHRKSN